MSSIEANPGAVSKRAIRLNENPPGNLPFSPAIRCGQFVFVAGQVGRDPSNGALAGPDVIAQTHQIMRNLKSILAAAGSSLDLVVKSTCFLSRTEDFAAFNEAYRGYFPADPPARSTVRVDLMAPELVVEIEVIALVAGARP